jgi:DNA replication and repair protein RecF
MHVTHLSLADFRSYAGVDVPLDPGVTAFVGPTGRARPTSSRPSAISPPWAVTASPPTPPSSAWAPSARSSGRRSRQGERQQLVELELNPGRANRARINRSSQVRPRDVLGIVRTVLFAPEDLALVKGDPGERRRFLDELITARSPRMAGVRSDYERVLKQRNTLLKSAALARRHGGRSMDLSTLDVWDQHLARVGAELLAQRLDLIAAVQPLADKAYEQLAPGGGPVALEYKPSAPGEAHTREDLYEQLMAAIAEARKQEIERGVTLVGPHRDDLILKLGQLPAKGYASHGESWSYALALRLASYDLLRAEGNEPVLVLDDVFAELDTRRRERLAELVAPGEQVLVTAAVDDDVPHVLAGTRYSVAEGAVERV